MVSPGNNQRPPQQGETMTIDDAFQHGFAHHQAGRLQEAESIYRQILQANPNHPETLNFLGLLGHTSGHSAKALELVERALSLKPDYGDAYTHKGIILSALGQREEALASFEAACKYAPDNPELSFNCAVLLQELGRFEDAANRLNKVLKLAPDHVRAMNNLGLSLNALDKFDEAIKWFEKALHIEPDFHEARHNKAIAHWHNEEPAIAEKLLKVSLERGLDPAGTNATLGQICQADGRIEEAANYLREAIRHQPDYGKAHMNLARLIKFTSEDDDVRAMKAAYAAPMSNPEDKIALPFALGKAYEDLGEYETSFKYYAEGNTLKRKTFNLDATHQDADLNAIQNTFTAKCFDQFNDAGTSDPTPIFIVGMPRSGTTLVEQILSSHPDVFGAGELYSLEEVIRSRFGSFQDIANSLSSGQITAADLTRAGSEYIDRLRTHDADCLHITDKMPANFANIGLIKLMLPNAKVIHCRRNPFDTGLSLFQTLFNRNDVNYAYDLAEIGTYYKLYVQCMDHWQEVLGDFVYHVDYEDLISDQETQSKALVSHVGLSWDDACLQFHNTKRTVKTASASQVRQPLYKKSIQRWKHFEPWLGPLFETLRD